MPLGQVVMDSNRFGSDWSWWELRPVGSHNSKLFAPHHSPSSTLTLVDDPVLASGGNDNYTAGPSPRPFQGIFENVVSPLHFANSRTCRSLRSLGSASS